jgi:hypothetical protein
MWVVKDLEESVAGDTRVGKIDGLSWWAVNAVKISVEEYRIVGAIG